MRMKMLFCLLSLALVTALIMHASASWAPVPNGSFESGTVGLVPDSWVMIANNVTDPSDAPKTATYIHEMQQTDQKYFEGGKSLWLHSRVVDEGLRIGRGSDTFAETEDWINAPSATHLRVYIRDIRPSHSLSWGWSDWIFLRVNDVDVAWTYYGGQYWGGIFADGEYLNFNYYNYTAIGVDGASWYVYEYSIPESVDKTHMKIQIGSHAWDWTFYDTSYFADLEFVVDKVELLSGPPSPLSASISPLSTSITVGNSVTFTSTVNGGTPPYSYQWYLDGNPVPSATSSSWTFTPTASGTYFTYCNVTDALGNTAQSETARVTVGGPVGGFSFSIDGHSSAKPMTPYLTLIAVITTGLIVIRRRTRRETK
jgi:hypothetical protein